MFKVIDIEDLNNDLSIALSSEIAPPTLVESNKCINLLQEFIGSGFQNIAALKRKHKINVKNSHLMQAYDMLIANKTLVDCQRDDLRSSLQTKKIKSQSGVVSITVFTSPYPKYVDKDGMTQTQKFSCKWNCAYCPNEPGQPRSYLKGEPGVLRANRFDFECVDQMHDRMQTLSKMCHNVDKLEILVLGGTWTSYPLQYRETFVRDIYFAANTFKQSKRCAMSLDVEKRLNKTESKCKIIGLTLETRPDTINAEEIVLFRYYGCTRVQLGIQHVDNEILQKINRGTDNQSAIDAIKMLKDTGFKIDAHWMPNLPGSSIEADDDMFMSLLDVRRKNGDVYELSCPELQVDQWKIYPCTVTPFTQISDWYKSGEYVPYDSTVLTDLIIKIKKLMFPWIRLNRIVRDIPQTYSISYDYKPNLRQDLQEIMLADGVKCRCIRCREVRDQHMTEPAYYRVRQYNASKGVEFFISCERSVSDDTLYGFVRLRLPSEQLVFPELNGCVFIRELHVYGKLAMVGEMPSNVQHRGIGKTLMARAKEIAHHRGFKKIAVIAGEGVKEYYQKLGYVESVGLGGYMILVL
jgi:ELP3 family radical SAM enzyme/protein acetyltransferase